MVRFALSTVSASLLLVMTAAPARADWLVSPYLGSAFGGATSAQHVTYGASAAWMSHGIVGVEFDGSIGPDLLDEDDGVILGIADSNVTTAMGSLVIGAPFGEPGVRPYVVAGAGLIRSRVSDAGDVFEIDENSFGINVGGGGARVRDGQHRHPGDLRSSGACVTRTAATTSTSSLAASTSGAPRWAPRSASSRYNISRFQGGP